MKLKLPIITIITLGMLLCSNYKAFADLQAVPNFQEPYNQRDSYDTDLFSGSSTYDYPIKVPKGTDDLTPEVSLSYNSSGTHDVTSRFGMGWDVNRDYIQRDVNYTPSSTSDDKYRLHFKGALYDLVYNPTDSLFHTKIESHLKIQQFLSGGQGTTGMYWQVTTPDGTLYRFGYASNSEIVCNGQSYDGYWNVDQVQDTHNNHIYYSYTTTSGVAYLNQIKYNNDQLREVDFNYVTNPYQRQLYVQGCNITETQRLSNIQVKASGNLVHEYDLSFTSAVNTQPLLTSITEKGSDGSTLPSTAVDYNPEVQQWQSQYTDWINNTTFDANLDNSDVRLVDVNGDGLPDVVKISYSGSNDTYLVYKNTGTTWNTQPETWLNNAPIDARFDEWFVRFLDVNGDGLPDIVKNANCNGNNSSWYVWLNTGTGWSSQSQTWVNNGPILCMAPTNNEIGLYDMDGDGLPDIVYTQAISGPNTTWEVFRNTGSSWSTTPTYWVNNQTFDARFDMTNVAVQDVNGDGLPDVVKSINNGGPNNDWEVYLNTGYGFNTTPQSWANPIDANIDLSTVTLADVNGDGLPDIVKGINNGGPSNDWEVYLNTGHSWNTQPVSWVNPIDANASQTNVRLADVNGDGLLDIVSTINNGGPVNTWRVWSNNGYAPDLLATLHTQEGGSSHYDYKPSTNYDNTGGDGLADLPFSLWVVQKMTQNNGMTNTQQTNDVTTYSYKNGLYNWQAKEFRGFGEVDTTEPNNAKKQYLFKQDDALKGNLYQSQTTDSSNNLYDKTEDTWTSSLANNIYTNTLTQEKNSTYDGAATNPKVKETDYQYDAYGNVTKKSELGDTSITGDERFTYNEYTVNTGSWIINTLKHTYQNAADDSTKVSEKWDYYDSHASVDDAPTLGDLTKEVKWLSGGTNPATNYSYDSYGNETSVTDANNHATSYIYGLTDTTNTYPERETNAKNQATNYSYDLGTGNLLSKTDPNGFTTSYTYDVFGRITKEIKPYDSSTYPTTSYTYFYDGTAPEGTLVSKRETSGASGTLDAYTYVDGFDRKIQTRSSAEDTTKQIVVDTFYDPTGEVAKETVPHLDTLSTSYVTPLTGTKTTTTTYDPISRVTAVTNPDGTSNTTAYNHWVLTKTNERGKTTKQYLNADEKIAQVDEVNGANMYSTTYTYDTNDNLTGITDASNNHTTFVYDTLGRKTSQTDPDMGTWHYAYDGVGNLTSQTDNRNITTAKTYDELNRVTKIDYPTDTDTLYTYDGNNKIGTLTSVTDAAGTVTYSYDNRLRKTQEQRVMDGTTWTTQYAYDALDRLTSQTNPDNTVINYAFNNQGEINSVNGVVNNIDYNAQNKITEKDFANGLTTNYTYNTTDFRLNNIKTGTLQDLSYTYDAIGNVSSITNNLTSKTQNFGYDDLDRLTSAQEESGYNYSYEYNPIGNLTKFTNSGVDTNYTYGQSAGAHAMTSSTGNNDLTIFDDQLAPGWTDASYNASNTITQNASDVYLGLAAIASTLSADGGLDFQAPSGVTTSGYTSLHFALKASQSGQQYEVYADSVYGQPLVNPVSLANYGGQPTTSGWTVYNIPLADLGAADVPLGDVVIHDATSSNQPAVYVDDVRLISAPAPTPTPTPTPAPTNTPTPTPSQQPYVVWEDSLASGWSDGSYNTTNTGTTNSADVYQGTTAIASTIGADGGLDFMAPANFTTNGYTTLTFALKASQSGQQYEVYIDTTYGQPLTTPVSLANYGGQPSSSQYTVYSIPLSDLGATNITLGDITIHDATGSNQPVLYVDTVELR